MTDIALTNIPGNFQLSSVGVGVVATGLEDIRQCIDTILRTIKGTDPFRPQFGSDVYLYTDAPLNIAIPNIKKSIFEAIDLWEPRITVTTITHSIDVAHLTFTITYRTLDGISDAFSWSFGDGVLAPGDGVQTGLILSAVIPAKVFNGYYKPDFVVNGNPVYPAPPAVGFATATEMLQWVTDNWFSYGRWYLTGNALVLYMNSGVAETASLNIRQTASVQIRKLIPQLGEGEFYTMTLQLDGVDALPVFPSGIRTLEGVILFLNNNWSAFGNWFVEDGNVTISAGDFSTDFSDEFDLGGVEVTQYLIFQTDKYATAVMEIGKTT